MLDVKELILKGADAVDARSRFDPKERALYMNASEAMTCIRKQWYARHQKDQPEQDWGFARRGKHGEVYMVEALRAANVPMLFTGDDQVGLRSDDRKLSATPDGLIWDMDGDDGWIGVEFKTMDPRTNRQNLPKIEHVTQLQIGMAMFDEAREEFPELGEHPIKYGLVIYMDASNFNDVIQHRVGHSPSILDRLEGRAKRMLRARKAASLEAEGRENGGNECRQRCVFKDVCWGDAAAQVQGGEGRTRSDSALTTLVEQFMVVKSAKDDATTKETKLKEEIKREMKARKKTRVVVGDHVVSLSTTAPAERFDRKAAEAAGLDLSPFVKTGAPSERLVVK